MILRLRFIINDRTLRQKPRSTISSSAFACRVLTSTSRLLSPFLCVAAESLLNNNVHFRDPHPIDVADPKAILEFEYGRFIVQNQPRTSPLGTLYKEQELRKSRQIRSRGKLTPEQVVEGFLIEMDDAGQGVMLLNIHPTLRSCIRALERVAHQSDDFIPHFF